MLASGESDWMLWAAWVCAASSSCSYVAWLADVSERPNAVSDGAFRVTTTSLIGTTGVAEPAPDTDAATSAAAMQTMGFLEIRVRMRGLEPPRPYGHTDLNRARLPIPPHPRAWGGV